MRELILTSLLPIFYLQKDDDLQENIEELNGNGNLLINRTESNRTDSNGTKSDESILNGNSLSEMSLSEA